jgi:biotin carboxylase
VSDYFARTPGPWLLKPRSEASAMGIKKIHHPDELWRTLEELGDRQSYFLLEKFVPGDVFHVDSVVWDGEVVFAAAHRYGLPPMAVYHGGGVFASSTVAHGSELEAALMASNRQVIAALGMARGVTHAEFIRAEAGGQLYFLEIAARVGGAGIDRLVEYASGVNPWVEWARVVVADLRGEPYTLAVAAPRLRRPDRLAGAAGMAGHRRLQRRRAGLAAAQAPSCRLHRCFPGSRARAGTGQRLRRTRGAYDFSASAPPLERPPE